MSGSLADDLLTGAGAIAVFLGWDRRSVYNVVEKKHGWPIWIEGHTYFASRSILQDHVAKRAREAINRQPSSSKHPNS